jgi:hypothetical protein
MMRRNAPTQEIKTSELREARTGLGWSSNLDADAAYVFICANLLNAALNNKRSLYNGRQRLAKESYSFKAHPGQAVVTVAQANIEGVRLFVAGGGLVYVSINGVQFSFHSIPDSPILRRIAALRRIQCKHTARMVRDSPTTDCAACLALGPSTLKSGGRKTTITLKDVG